MTLLVWKSVIINRSSTRYGNIGFTRIIDLNGTACDIRLTVSFGLRAVISGRLDGPPERFLGRQTLGFRRIIGRRRWLGFDEHGCLGHLVLAVATSTFQDRMGRIVCRVVAFQMHEFFIGVLVHRFAMVYDAFGDNPARLVKVAVVEGRGFRRIRRATVSSCFNSRRGIGPVLNRHQPHLLLLNLFLLNLFLPEARRHSRPRCLDEAHDYECLLSLNGDGRAESREEDGTIIITFN